MAQQSYVTQHILVVSTCTFISYTHGERKRNRNSSHFDGVKVEWLVAPNSSP